MRVLFVASFNKHQFAPFILEQAEALRCAGCEVEFFGVEGKGLNGYLKALPGLNKQIRSFSPDVVHAHYGLCGLLAGLQRMIPVVTTYHGSDINLKSVRLFSKMSMFLSAHNIFVSKRTMALANPHSNYSLIPCGIDITDLQLTGKYDARDKIGLSREGKYVLFAGAFNNSVKNYPLAESAMKQIPNAELVELKGYSRDQALLLMCAADAFLMTSFSEGSPQVIKEAMACGCPIVSVDVGDVKEVVDGVDGCFVTTRDPEEIAAKLNIAIERGARTEGRVRILELGLGNDVIVEKLLKVYRSI